MHKHSYEIDKENWGFNGPGSPIVWFRCKADDCTDHYQLAPRGLMYHALLGRDQDMWLEYVASDGKHSIYEWRTKGWLAFPQRQPWCDECAGPYPLDEWPGSQYAGHWDTCPNRWAAIGVEASRVRARENDPSSSSS